MKDLPVLSSDWKPSSRVMSKPAIHDPAWRERTGFDNIQMSWSTRARRARVNADRSISQQIDRVLGLR